MGTRADTDHDGFLSYEEIESGMRGFDDHEYGFGQGLDWKKVVKSCDRDGDGRISYEEFFTAASDRAKVLNSKFLRQAFAVMDLDGNGEIEAAELRACFAKGQMGDYTAAGVAVEEEYFDKIIQSIDENGDGKVTYEEFEAH